MAALFVAWLVTQPLVLEARRRRLRQRPFPAAWSEILRRRMPYFWRLPTDLQLQLKGHIQVFVSEKPFVGCGDLAVTDDMRVTIAAQACLLVLNRRPRYYPNLSQILIYPGAFIVDKVRTDGIGILQEQRQVLAGESWSQGQVILSWTDVVEGAAVADDGRNVVIHEFAHQLDQEFGHANGAPILARRQHYQSWSRVLRDAFSRLQEQARLGELSLLSHYGATDPAEFFAVASEVFFEQPERLAVEDSALYAELHRFYRVDPLSW
ncbi:MAG: M90 family metallopeptidase [Casimicrobiaceae bacterium]